MDEAVALLTARAEKTGTKTKRSGRRTTAVGAAEAVATSARRAPKKTAAVQKKPQSARKRTKPKAAKSGQN
jgi:hypothetical protein